MTRYGLMEEPPEPNSMDPAREPAWRVMRIDWPFDSKPPVRSFEKIEEARRLAKKLNAKRA